MASSTKPYASEHEGDPYVSIDILDLDLGEALQLSAVLWHGLLHSTDIRRIEQVCGPGGVIVSASFTTNRNLGYAESFIEEAAAKLPSSRRMAETFKRPARLKGL